MSLRRRFWAEPVLAVATGILAAVAVLSVVSLGPGLTARREHARTHALEA